MKTHETASSGYRSLGLLADPFLVTSDGSADPPGINLTIRSASLRLLSAMDAAASDPTHKPILVEKSGDVPPYYSVAALAGLLASLSEGAVVEGLLSAYIPLDMMRLGRVRAVLNAIAERIAGSRPDVTIALWARRTLAEPDTQLPEWDALVSAGLDVSVLVAEIDADPVAFAARVFGECVESREGADDFEALMRVSTSRQDRLDSDPDDDSATVAPEAEDATDDPLAEVFATPLSEIDPDALPEGSPAGLMDAIVADYVAAYTKKHLSPVVARGIRAYKAQGFASMAEELKITKAPSKTLVALFTFGGGVYRSGMVVYDRFEMWPSVPQDLRGKIVATLTELRWALKDSAALVLLCTPGTAPEVEEAFSAATRVPWKFDELERVNQADSVFDAEVARWWLSSASVAGVIPDWADEVFSAVPDGTNLGDACDALSYAISRAIDSGASAPSAAAVTEALGQKKEAAPA